MNYMKKFRISFLPLLIAVLCSTGNCQQTIVFSEAEGRGPNQSYYEFEKWSFSSGGIQYEIAKNGRVSRKDENGHSGRFRIALKPGEEFQRAIYFSEYNNDLILLCETHLGDGGAGFVTRLDRNTLKPKWRVHIPGFNIANGTREDNAAYIAAIGFVGKINLENGKYIWKHENLYRKYKESGAFNIFETPQITGKLVVFKEEETGNQIEVNKATGKIVKVLVD